jgi:hypothetical protein
MPLISRLYPLFGMKAIMCPLHLDSDTCSVTVFSKHFYYSLKFITAHFRKFKFYVRDFLCLLLLNFS